MDVNEAVVDELRKVHDDLREARADVVDKKREYDEARSRERTLYQRQNELVDELIHGQRGLFDGDQPAAAETGAADADAASTATNDDPEAWKHVSVDELRDHGAPARAMNALATEDIDTLGELATYQSTGKLSDLKGMGAKSLEQLEEAQRRWFTANQHMYGGVDGAEDDQDASDDAPTDESEPEGGESAPPPERPVADGSPGLRLADADTGERGGALFHDDDGNELPPNVEVERIDDELSEIETTKDDIKAAMRSYREQNPVPQGKVDEGLRHMQDRKRRESVLRQRREDLVGSIGPTAPPEPPSQPMSDEDLTAAAGGQVGPDEEF